MAGLLESKGWKNFMSKLYGFGAAVVIMGALFKILHWPGAVEMLTIGMSVEAIIFIFSAFEKPHEDPNWALVYPELGGGEPVHRPVKAHKEAVHVEDNANAVAVQGVSSVVASVDLSGIDTQKLREGINKLGDTASRLSDISRTVDAIDNMTQSIQQASSSVGELSKASEQSSVVLTESAGILATTYQDVAQNVATQGKEASKSVEMVSKGFSAAVVAIEQELKSSVEGVKKGNTEYNHTIESLNKHMGALNSVYELQTKSFSTFQKNTTEMGLDLQQLVKELQATAQENKNFRTNLVHLNTSLSDLNNVYGSMLTAVNSVVNKR